MTTRDCRMCTGSYASGTYRVHKQTHAPGTHRPADPARPRRRGAKDRSLLLSMIRAGASGAAVARVHGISRERVRAIWFTETGLALPKRGRIKRDLQTLTVRRFWSRVAVDASGCWLWIGALHRNGYGSFCGKYAHRVAYQFVKGPIPTGLSIDHLCRVHACVNPDHLEAVTQRENVMRSPIAPAAINARKTHCKHGHELPPVGSSRNRTCATCRATYHMTPEYRAHKSQYDRQRHGRRRTSQEVAA